MSELLLGVFAGLTVWFAINVVGTFWSLGRTVTVDAATLATKIIMALIALVGVVFYL